ncbi:Transcription factor [Cordyceps fumosorosea ARSEF 2679]|uniref:Transcription factor n=1 Tax=Cordyceps fumosorosea (strain ARSEF 2679) TaxID=1081104 RepID=A0A162MY42_CORFA|nr:Transcription factor [Cordyceps fumosorosea ARSEF 2679]OAA72499.1 Transcription factor [Cordyceps fumosorosea ARSEF 2679]
MDLDLSLDDGALPSVPPQKRSRVLLSCAPCRNSKLKCDRSQPCSQCAKKDRPEACVYAPRPVKKKPPPKGMSARLKRLEGMVRSMLEAEAEEKAGEDGRASRRRGSGEGKSEDEKTDAQETRPAQGQVVRSLQGSTYVGATHCMAMLEDIEDMKTYFDDEDDELEGDSPGGDLDAAEMLLSPRAGPASREELIGHIPEKHIADRLIMRYFSSSSPSQFCVHRPTFTRNYARFWQDPDSMSLPWIAQLFMILALGVIFNHFSAPEELRAESATPVLQRIQKFRSCAGWALVWSKYTNPTPETIPAFILYVEAYFLFSRAAQMSCYTLSAVCLRLMLKLGMHRDPGRLAAAAALTPYEAEMRRRWWSMACQVELLVSFHMGLPSMLHGVESDVEVHGNHPDEDFDEDTCRMPPPRPLSEHTALSYSINKIKILRVFGRIAKQAHALTPPTYADTMRLDAALNDTWDRVPPFLRVRPLDRCIGDAPTLLIQRYGIEALYHKCRCVLHRRHLTEIPLRPEHDYSRRQCLDAALTLLDFQLTIWNATRPGSMLSMCGWFVTSLSVHDFMLAAMVVYVVARSPHYPEQPGVDGHERWAAPGDSRLRSRRELTAMLRRSHAIWCRVSSTVGELRKTRDTLAVMLAKLGCPVDEGSGADPRGRVPGGGGGLAMAVPPPQSSGNDLGFGQQNMFATAPPPPSLISGGQLSSAAASANQPSTGSESTQGFNGTMMDTDFSSAFDMPLVGNDQTVVTFPGLEVVSVGADLSGKETSASGEGSDGIFGTVEFESSWMGDDMDWVSADSASRRGQDC